MWPESRVGSFGSAECLRLLGRPGIGRVALSLDALPAILPVASALFDGDVPFPMAPDSRANDAVKGAVIAFETGASEPDAGRGWTVRVLGTSETSEEPTLGLNLLYCRTTRNSCSSAERRAVGQRPPSVAHRSEGP